MANLATRTGRMISQDNPEALAGELAAEPVLICTRPLKYGGKQYAIGDEIKLTGGLWDGLLLQQGAFTSRKRWEAARSLSAEKKFKRDVLEPLQNVYHQVASAEAKAQAELAAAHEALRAAQDRVVVAADQKRRAEQAITDATAGTITDALKQEALQANLRKARQHTADTKHKKSRPGEPVDSEA